MKKLILFSVLMLCIIGCEKDFTTVVDPQQSANVADSVNFPFAVKTMTQIPVRQVVPAKIPFVIGIAFPADTIKFFEIRLVRTDISGGASTSFFLFDNGIDGDVKANDSSYTNTLEFALSDTGRSYKMSLYAYNKKNQAFFVSQQSFSTIANTAPQILSINAPDTLKVSAPTVFFLYAKVDDKDGISDIASVYYKFGDTSSVKEYPLINTGTDPDAVAGDSVFTAGVSINQDNTKGTYPFYFYAVDKAGYKSRVFKHSIVIK